MQAKNLPDILGKNGFKQDGDAFLAPSGVSCSVYLGLGDDALIIDRASAVPGTTCAMTSEARLTAAA